MKTFPSLREKRRYLVFEVISDRKHGFDETRESILSFANKLLGNLGMAKAKIRLLADRFDQERQKGIIVCERKSVDKVRASLCMTTHVNSHHAIIRSLGVSGILKKALAKHY